MQCILDELANVFLPSLGTVMPQGFTESPSYLSQILKAYLDDRKFPRGSTLLQYLDGLLLCSLSQGSSQGDSIQFAKAFSLKGTWGCQRENAVCPNPDLISGHLLSEQGLHLDPVRLHGILSFPKPKTKCQLWGFLWIIGYCQNWIPNFSLMAKPQYVLLNNNNPNPILWKEPED